MNDSIANQKSPEMKALENRSSNVLTQVQIDNIIQRGDYTYTINVSDYEEVMVTLKGVLYLIEVSDPKGHKWIVRKTYADCETLHSMLQTHILDEDKYKFDFPVKISKLFPKKEDYLEMCAELTQYFQAVFDELSRFEKPIADAIGVFIEAKYMIIPVNKTVKRAEAMPNMFLKLKKEFNEQLVAKNAASKDDGRLNYIIFCLHLLFIHRILLLKLSNKCIISISDELSAKLRLCAAWTVSLSRR